MSYRNRHELSQLRFSFADPILDQRHSLPVSVNTGETSIISFTWKRAINVFPVQALLTDCCWSVSDVRLTADVPTINMTVNTCANGDSAYNCSDATWFCGPAVITNLIGFDDSQVTSGSFKIIPSTINGKEMIEATVDNECSGRVILPVPTLPVCLSQILTLPTNVMLPVIVCESDGVWIKTVIETTVTIPNACYCGTTAGE